MKKTKNILLLSIVSICCFVLAMISTFSYALVINASTVNAATTKYYSLYADLENLQKDNLADSSVVKPENFTLIGGSRDTDYTALSELPVYSNNSTTLVCKNATGARIDFQKGAGWCADSNAKGVIFTGYKQKIGAKWTAPTSGAYRVAFDVIHAKFEKSEAEYGGSNRQYWDGAKAEVFLDNVSLGSEQKDIYEQKTTGSITVDVTVRIEAGQTLYFVLDCLANGWGDAYRVNAVIENTDVKKYSLNEEMVVNGFEPLNFEFLSSDTHRAEYDALSDTSTFDPYNHYIYTTSNWNATYENTDFGSSPVFWLTKDNMTIAPTFTAPASGYFQATLLLKAQNSDIANAANDATHGDALYVRYGVVKNGEYVPMGTAQPTYADYFSAQDYTIGISFDVTVSAGDKITFSLDNGSFGWWDSWYVNMTVEPVMAVEGVKVLNVGESVYLNVKSTSAPTFESLNDVLSVDNEGKVTALTLGNGIIKVTADDIEKLHYVSVIESYLTEWDSLGFFPTSDDDGLIDVKYGDGCCSDLDYATAVSNATKTDLYFKVGWRKTGNNVTFFSNNKMQIGAGTIVYEFTAPLDGTYSANTLFKWDDEFIANTSIGGQPQADGITVGVVKCSNGSYTLMNGYHCTYEILANSSNQLVNYNYALQLQAGEKLALFFGSNASSWWDGFNIERLTIGTNSADLAPAFTQTNVDLQIGDENKTLEIDLKGRNIISLYCANVLLEESDYAYSVTDNSLTLILQDSYFSSLKEGDYVVTVKTDSGYAYFTATVSYVKLPVPQDVEGKTFVGYLKDNSLYQAGTIVRNANDYTPVYVKVTTAPGASIRIGGVSNSGIRFAAALLLNDDVTTVLNMDTTELGTRWYCERMTTTMDIEAVKVQDVSGERNFNGVLTGLSEKYYNYSFSIRPYLTVKYADGETKTFLFKESDRRSIYQVAREIIDSLADEQTEQCPYQVTINGEIKYSKENLNAESWNVLATIAASQQA